MEEKQLSERFKINGSEINEVILKSPYSLADSPASLGQKSSQTKRYFYQFINTLAEKINLHLGEIDKAISECASEISEAHDKISELGENTSVSLSEHNESASAHADIRQKIIDEKNSHDRSLVCHEDIRDAISLVMDELGMVSALAMGKNRAVSFEDEIELFEYALSNGRVGDVLLLEDPSKPDFTVVGVGTTKKSGDTELDINDVAMGEEILPDKKYFIGGVRLVSSEGRLETSLLVKKEELNSHREYLMGILENVDTRLYELEAELLTKESAISKHTVTGESVFLENMNEYHLGTVSSLTITTSEDEFFEAILCFKTGSGEISVDAPSELLFVGDDTLEGRFYPVSKRLYEVSVKLVSGVMLARVGSVDYEVIS